MINRGEILQTIEMIDQQHLDVRTVTMGISLLDCCDPDPDCGMPQDIRQDNPFREGSSAAQAKTSRREFGIPIVNKRISVTPIALVAGASETEDYVPFAKALDAARAETGVNFVGGFSALVQKGMTPADLKLIRAIPQASGGDRARLLLSKHRLDESRHKHGRRRAHGRDSEGDCAAHIRQGRFWLRKARRVLQRGRGQPLYGRRFSWRVVSRTA